MKNWNLYRTLRDNVYLTPSRLGLVFCVAVTAWAMFFTANECKDVYNHGLGKASQAQKDRSFQVAVHEACKKQPVELLWVY